MDRALFTFLTDYTLYKFESGRLYWLERITLMFQQNLATPGTHVKCLMYKQFTTDQSICNSLYFSMEDK